MGPAGGFARAVVRRWAGVHHRAARSNTSMSRPRRSASIVASLLGRGGDAAAPHREDVVLAAPATTADLAGGLATADHAMLKEQRGRSSAPPIATPALRISPSCA